MSQTCRQCHSEAADDASFCPNCGATLSAPAATTAAPAGAAPSASTMPEYKFDAARWSLADRITGVATLVLFISLFLPWFNDNLGIVIFHWSGVGAHWYLYFVMIACILIIAYLVLRAGWEELPVRANVPHVSVMMAATIFNLVLVFLGFIFKPGGYGVSGVGWSFFSFVGLIAAIVAAAPFAVPQLRAKTMG